jgi:hypothetical protein
MLNDFLPAIISVGILIGVFLFAWISDVRRIQRHNNLELRELGILPRSKVTVSSRSRFRPDLG